MVRFVLLLQFTDKGLGAVKDSPTRAHEFADLAARAGARIEAQFWLTGEYDGLVIVSAATADAVAALALQLSSRGFVRTHLYRAYDEAEMRAALAKI
ncbi:MAG: GYD domain-containing protein [Gemmataceae bacterium]|nr:GYD domain-containing protein [Gemmataceae bacterium]